MILLKMFVAFSRQKNEQKLLRVFSLAFICSKLQTFRKARPRCAARNLLSLLLCARATVCRERRSARNSYLVGRVGESWRSKQ